MLPTVCILAGGLGTRLGERVRDTPKPLLEVADEPFLVHQLRLLAGHGAGEAVLCVGYLGERIRERLGGECCGIALRYSFDGPDLDGTLGAVRRALPMLGERFLVLNGDTYLPIDYRAAAEEWRGSGLPALMGVLHNEDRHEPSNARYERGLVVEYDKRAPRGAMEWIDCGVGGLQAGVVSDAGAELGELAELYARLARERLLCGFAASERYYEIGTPAALAETDEYLRAREANMRGAAARGAVSRDAAAREEVSRDAAAREEVSRDAVARNAVARNAISRCAAPAGARR